MRSTKIIKRVFGLRLHSSARSSQKQGEADGDDREKHRDLDNTSSADLKEVFGDGFSGGIDQDMSYMELECSKTTKVTALFPTLIPRNGDLVTLVASNVGEDPVKFDPFDTESNMLGDSVLEMSKPLMRRLRLIELTVTRARDSNHGVKRKDKVIFGKTVLETFSGSDLINWMMNNCDIFDSDEASKFAKFFLQYGYIISVIYSTEFSLDGYYIFQCSYLWASRPFTISKKDYLLYLAKRFNADYHPERPLVELEDNRRRKLVKMFQKDIDKFEVAINKHLSLIEALSSNEQRIFLLQEWSFWKFHRNTDVSNQKESKRPRKTEEEIEAQLHPDELTLRLEANLESLRISLVLNRSKVSTSCQLILRYCLLRQSLDPFTNPELAKINPFIIDDTKIWDTEKKLPTAADLRLWCNSLLDLLSDPCGIGVFSQFLKTEFSDENLDFCLMVEKLDEVATYQDFMVAALSIFDDFVPVGAPRELNITSQCRKELERQFSAVKAKLEDKPLPDTVSKTWRLQPNVFVDAYEHILHLMAKDTYKRFLASDILHAHLSREGVVLNKPEAV